MTQSWFKDILLDPRPDRLDTEIRNIRERSKQIGNYKELCFEWYEGALRSNNLHIKQLCICWFLLLDDQYRAYVAATCQKSTRMFNSFMHKLETYNRSLVFGLTPEGEQIDLAQRDPRKQTDWTMHCGHFAVMLIDIASQL